MSIQILIGDCRALLPTLPDESVHCVVTSPPYFRLRDYGVAGQIGRESTPDAYVAELVAVFRDVRRVLRKNGTLWLVIGDSYATRGTRQGNRSGGIRKPGECDTHRNKVYSPRFHDLKDKDLIGVPWRVAFALQADGWWLRQDIVWQKLSPMPESVRDRCTRSHEYVFLLSKSARYYFDAAAIAEPEKSGANGSTFTRGKTFAAANVLATVGQRPRVDDGLRNKRSVWSIATQPLAEAHFATFPPALVEPCILAGCPPNGTVLDPFGGAGTTGLVADRLQRNAILIELNPDYAQMAQCRIARDAPLFAEVG